MAQQAKSRVVSALLTILLGPLGLFYTTMWGGLAVTALALVTAPTVIGPVIAWLVAIFWGDSLAKGSTTTRPVPEETSGRIEVLTQERKNQDRGVLVVEGLAWLALILLAVLWLPDQLGRVEGESALHFYLHWLGGER